MNGLALACQLLLLGYHQVTTLVDLFPFNGVRHSARAERFVEAGVNAMLMGLGPLGFALGNRALMLYAAVYYFVLFAFEIIIWWVPYFTAPSGRARRLYNLALSVATTSFGQPDVLAEWAERHRRLHAGTISPLRQGVGPITPNLEHILLHAWTLVTAIVTLYAYLCAGR
jgi:hypothetical protein